MDVKKKVPTTMRPQRLKIKPKDEAAHFVSLNQDKDGFDVQYINSYKGRGVFSKCHIQAGAFLLEYRGDLINREEYERRVKVYHDAMKVFMFEFRHDGKKLCVDAATDDGSLGRLVNDDHLSPNSRMKTVKVNGKPHLCLFAIKDINPGEEITYNYGNYDWPWRVKVSACPDKTPGEEQMVSLSSSLEPQVSACPDKTPGEEQMVSLSSSLEPQVSACPDKTPGEEQMVSLSSSLEPQVSACPDKTPGEEQMVSLSSSLEPQVSACPDKTPGEEQMVSLSSSLEPQICNHVVLHSSFSSIDKCLHCLGPYAPLKWDGLKCKVCSSVWHKMCYEKTQRTYVPPTSLVSDDSNSSVSSEEEYVPDSASYSDASVELEIDGSNHLKRTDLDACFVETLSDFQNDNSGENVLAESPMSESEDNAKEVMKKQTKRSSGKKQPVESPDIQTEGISVEPLTESEAVESIQSTSISSSRDKKNYCFICGKPQSKITRHLQVHEKTNAEVAQAFAQPKASKQRKKMLEQLRNKGNCTHNSEVFKNGTGLLKIKRKPKLKYNVKQYVHCMFCQGLYLRKHLWRHAHKCVSKPGTTDEKGPKRVLSLASMMGSALCQQISQGVWKLLTGMKDDEVSGAVRSDFYILQLAQSFFNKHGQDPSKHEYIRQKIREVGRLLIILRSEFSVYNIEDAVRPSNFHILIQAVKRVSGFDEGSHSFKTPSLALKLGHSLNKISDLICCTSLVSGDEELRKSCQAFKKLYSSKWSELVSHTALTTLSDKRFNKPSTLPFTEDVQRLHQHLEKIASSASETLRSDSSPQVYKELCRSTLAKIILFNRRRGGEVSKMLLSNFQDRDTTPLHKDVAVGLTTFERRLCAHFSRVEIKGKRGRKVAVLLSPDMVEAIIQLIRRRTECGVPEENPFLFARPNCLTPYRGQDCLRVYANDCGAQNPELLRSTQLRKHVATLSQVLNLKNHELDQVADFLGHNIRVHRDYYRLPEATTQLAKISKLLLAMERGTLGNLQGKTLEEIEIEDKLDLTDSESGQSEVDCDPSPLENIPQSSKNQELNKSSDATDDPGEGASQGRTSPMPPVEKPSRIVKGCRKPTSPVELPETSPGKGKEESTAPPTEKPSDAPDAFPENETEKDHPQRNQKRPWSSTEIAAVMRHFREHIESGKLASFIEIQQCQKAEHPALKNRSLQNIRDFVRNRGVSKKRKKNETENVR
ncbi:uncharacterized protein ACNS7B_000282 isoform 5-T5 [Menidia menidia]